MNRRSFVADRIRRARLTAAAGVLAALAIIVSGCELPQTAVDNAAVAAASKGTTSFVSVVDRSSGIVVGGTQNAHNQVASESIMKLFLAAYYLKSYGGHQSTPQRVRDQLAFIIQYSDDATTNTLFTASAIPTVAGWYGLTNTSNAWGNPGYWGAARITAHDMATFMYRAAQDPQVGPWLLPTMAGTARTGSGPDAHWDQFYGLNALSGEHGSKQGWGCDSYWTTLKCAIHSVGYTDKYFVAILQLGRSLPGNMPASATATAKRIQTSVRPTTEGDFVLDQRNGAVFRIAGGAPVYVSTWAAFGGPKPVWPKTAAEFDRLPRYPRDGTFIRDVSTGAVFRVVGGTPFYVTSWALFGGPQPTIDVDGAAIRNAGGAQVWSHLAASPPDGTFVRSAHDYAVYRIVGGAPLYVTSWQPFGGVQPTVYVDGAALDHAGGVWPFHTLRARPLPGTWLLAQPAGNTYRIDDVGRALRDTPPATVTPLTVNQETVDRAGTGPRYNHLAR